MYITRRSFHLELSLAADQADHEACSTKHEFSDIIFQWRCQLNTAQYCTLH